MKFLEKDLEEIIYLSDRDKLEGHVEVMGEKYFIKNIHELQNLYFIITGKELTVNSKNIYYES